MSNAHLMPTNASTHVAVPEGTPWTITGDNNNIFINSPIQNAPTTTPSGIGRTLPLDPRFCHILVTELNTDAPYGRVSIPKEHCLAAREGTPQKLHERLARLETEHIEELKRYPAILANPNDTDAHPGDYQLCVYGRLTEIHVGTDLIHISYTKRDTLFQQNIVELAGDLDLWGNDRTNELDRPHWALKQVDLFAVLKRTDISFDGELRNLVRR